MVMLLLYLRLMSSLIESPTNVVSFLFSNILLQPHFLKTTYQDSHPRLLSFPFLSHLSVLNSPWPWNLAVSTCSDHHLSVLVGPILPLPMS